MVYEGRMMKSGEIKSNASQQESNSISYTSKIFPHIIAPSRRIEDLSECLWELFSYGPLSQKSLNLLQLFLGIPDFNSMNKRKRTAFIRAFKNKVAQINRYVINDEEMIFALLKDLTFQRSNSLNDQDFAIIAELVKNPFLSSVELQKRVGLSRTYVSRRRKQLINDGVIKFRLHIDPHYFGLSHYLFVFTTDREMQHNFEELFIKNPYLMNMKKSFIFGTKKTEILYLLSFYIPYRQEKRFSMWIKQLKHYNLVSTHFLLKVNGFAHSFKFASIK